MIIALWIAQRFLVFVEILPSKVMKLAMTVIPLRAIIVLRIVRKSQELVGMALLSGKSNAR